MYININLPRVERLISSRWYHIPLYNLLVNCTKFQPLALILTNLVMINIRISLSDGNYLYHISTWYKERAIRCVEPSIHHIWYIIHLMMCDDANFTHIFLKCKFDHVDVVPYTNRWYDEKDDILRFLQSHWSTSHVAYLLSIGLLKFVLFHDLIISGILFLSPRGLETNLPQNIPKMN